MQPQYRTKSEKLAELLDSRYRIPGTDIRFGIDPILGLIPGAGDWLGGMISTYFMLCAVLLGANATVLLRMFLNIIADLVIGSIPVLGELFDVAWKANLRNAELLRELEEHPDELAAESRWLLWALLVLFVAVILGTLFALGWLIARLFELLL